MVFAYYSYFVARFPQKEEFVMVLNKLVMEVKSLFAQETNILEQLELVDWIQKLGLANHFQKEINGFLESINPSEEQDLQVSALCFRLLRNHGFAVLPGNRVFSLRLTMLVKNIYI